MGAVRSLTLSNFYVQENAKEQLEAIGDWIWLDGEKSWVWVNVEYNKFKNESERQYYCPTEKACYSHSPPDMELSVGVILYAFLDCI